MHDDQHDHTPGPWRAICVDVTGARPVEDDGERFWEVVPAGEGFRGHVANVFAATNIPNGIRIEERNANAHLIAAAPELLALLEELIDIEGPQPGTAEWAGRVRAAIARARGEAE